MEEIKNPTITEEQLEQVIDTLSLSNNEPTKVERAEDHTENLQVFSDNEVVEDNGLEEGYVDMAVDSDSGVASFVPPQEATETDKKDFQEIFNISDIDMMEFVSVVNRFRAGEKFSVFNALPESLKTMVRAMCMQNDVVPTQEVLAKVTKEVLIDEFTRTQELNSALDTFNAEMKEMTEIPSLADLYADSLKEAMETKVLEEAEKIKDTNPEGAEKLYKVVDTYKDTYTFTTLKDTIENRFGKVRKHVKPSILKRELESFRFMLSKSTIFNFPDPDSIIGILCRKLNPDVYDEYESNIFMMAIYETLIHKDINNIYDAEWTYYTIRNIINVDFSDMKSEFNKELIANIEEVFKLIESKLQD